MRIIKNYLVCLATILLVFFALIFILNIFEEISFLKDKNNSFYYSIVLTLLNTPYLIYDISPFIFFIGVGYIILSFESWYIKFMKKGKSFLFTLFSN